MKLIIFLTFAISCFALSGADSITVGYRLAMAPLEFHLRNEKKEIRKCYEVKSSTYEESVIKFSERITDLKNKINNIFGTNTYSKNRIMGALNEAHKISDSLKAYFLKLREIIFNKPLVEGGNVVWNERRDIENYYSRYEGFGNEVKNRKENHYPLIFPLINEAFDKILKESDELTNELLDCFEKQNISLTKKT